MLEFELKRKNKKRLYSKVTLFLLIIAFLFIFNGTFKIFKKELFVKKDLDSYQANLIDHQNKKENLKKKIEFIESNVGREETLRENYSLAKEDEKVIVIIGDEEPEEQIEEKQGSLSKIKSFLGGLFN